MNRTDTAGAWIAAKLINVFDKITGRGSPGAVRATFALAFVLLALGVAVDVRDHRFWLLHLTNLLCFPIFLSFRRRAVRVVDKLATHPTVLPYEAKRVHHDAGFFLRWCFVLIFLNVWSHPHLLSDVLSNVTIFAIAIAHYMALDGNPGSKVSVLARAKARLKAVKVPQLIALPPPVPS